MVTAPMQAAQDAIASAYRAGAIDRPEYLLSLYELHTAWSVKLAAAACVCPACVELRRVPA